MKSFLSIFTKSGIISRQHFCVFQLYGSYSMGIFQRSCFNLCVALVEDPTHDGSGDRNIVIHKKLFVSHLQASMLLKVRLRGRDSNRLIYNFARFGRGKFFPCILSIIFSINSGCCTTQHTNVGALLGTDILSGARTLPESVIFPDFEDKIFHLCLHVKSLRQSKNAEKFLSGKNIPQPEKCMRKRFMCS